MFGNCNHCCFCCGHPCTMLGVSLFISCKNKIQCVCVEKKKKDESGTVCARSKEVIKYLKEQRSQLQEALIDQICNIVSLNKKQNSDNVLKHFGF